MAKTPKVSQGGLQPLTKIAVSGFKSIGNEQSIEVAPLTLLAGVNSSGKSSIMQPLLLLKQTLEAPYDPGPLLLNGPNVKFTKVEQFLHTNSKPKRDYFEVVLTLDEPTYSKWKFQKGQRYPIEIPEQLVRFRDQVVVCREGESHDSEHHIFESFHPEFNKAFVKAESRLLCKRERCFLNLELLDDGAPVGIPLSFGNIQLEANISHLIHLAGSRSNPLRSYPLTATGSQFPGTFDHYTASVIAAEARSNDAFAEKLGSHLKTLGLTWKVVATPVDDTQVEIKVGRLPEPARGGAQDLVNIADVGFGVSQTLPVVVALLVAKPNQTVYIEQPEIHLHPRAQHAMAELLIDAANRGVRVIIETHSSMLLLGVQSLIAKGQIKKDDVRLHWFNRDDKTGTTTINTAKLDDAGTFGDWPVDFDDVALDAQNEYLTAAQKRLAKKR